jgi:hypothetical protein
MMASKLNVSFAVGAFLLAACQPEISGPESDDGGESVGTDTSVSDGDSGDDESTGDDEGDAVCGNGEVEPGETCDGDCPEECSAPDACTNYELVGDPDACDSECVEVQNEMCGPKDGCCPGGCNTPDDEDCVDGDRDGLGDVMEEEHGTDPLNPDSDGDGFYDWDEVLRGTDPLDPAEYPPAYDGLTAYGGDTHVHGSTAMELVTLYWGYDYSDCSETGYIGGNQPHSHVWCDRLFQRGKVNGLDWMAMTSHDFGITDWLSDHGNTGDYKQAVLEFWKDNPDFVDPYFGDDPDYQYPTHPDGFPLYTQEGHTNSEWLSLQNCAEYETEEGSFVAFGGIEYTAQAGGDGCGPNPYCGGHKTVMYLHTSDKVCTATYQNPSQSCNETQLYEHIREKGGVANIAHPDWLGPKLVPHDPNTAISGIDDDMLMGVELRFGANLDLEEAKPNHSYRDMLDAGFRTQPVYGSDTHNWPEDTCSSSQGPGKGLNGPRTVCWGTTLNRGELLGSFLQHRCYYSSKGKAELRFEVEGRPMGSKLGLSHVADADAGLSIVVDVQRRDGHSLGEWDLIHDGEVVLADMPCDPSGDWCHWEGTVSEGDLTGYYYVRVTDGEAPNEKRLISSPVWIEP